MAAGRPAIDETTISEIVEFHGHMCPGLAMGVQAARIALDEIGPHATDEEVVAVTETDMCGVDAVQFLTGCTFGKGNLIHHDYGKNAFSFYRRADNKAIRVAARSGVMRRDPDEQALFDKVRSGDATDDERELFATQHVDRSWRVLAMEPDELFAVQDLQGEPPPKARIHPGIRCDACGEDVMATRVHHKDGRNLCRPCFEAAA